MTQFNAAFLNRLHLSPSDSETAHEYHFTTFSVSDPSWYPTGPRSRPPGLNSEPRYSHGTACRLALSLNLERMHRKPKGVHQWSVVCGGNAKCTWHKWTVAEIRVSKKGSPKWNPVSPFDLPPSVESVTMTPQEFSAWMMERNAALLRELRQWTVIVSPIVRTFREMDTDAAMWLQEIDAATFQTDVEPMPAYRIAKPETVQSEDSHANGHHRLYRVGMVDERGTVIPTGEALPQADALELLERTHNPTAVLIPAVQ